jgi:hypothetical protein
MVRKSGTAERGLDVDDRTPEERHVDAALARLGPDLRGLRTPEEVRADVAVVRGALAGYREQDRRAADLERKTMPVNAGSAAVVAAQHEAARIIRHGDRRPADVRQG